MNQILNAYPGREGNGDGRVWSQGFEPRYLRGLQRLQYGRSGGILINIQEEYHFRHLALRTALILKGVIVHNQKRGCSSVLIQ
jgi:hypothetical protein